jgi:hypothetical protein
MNPCALDAWELAALAALVAAIVVAGKRRRRRPPGLPVDGKPLTCDEWAALDRIEVATLISQGLIYDDGGDLP